MLTRFQFHKLCNYRGRNKAKVKIAIIERKCSVVLGKQ